MIQDIHSHTYYSACGKDDPHLTVQAAIDGGIELFGISDHNYGIADRKPQYYKEMTSLREEYKGKIRILCGIEIATVNNLCITPEEDVSYFDYCLVEHIDRPDSSIGRDIVNFSKRCGCRTGIAHTNLIAMARARGEDPVEFLKELADNRIFWEMNVNYDSIHSFNEHQYVKDFYNDLEIREIVRKSGIEISVGFDGHRVYDYKPERVVKMCRFLEENGFKMPEFEGIG